MKSTNNIIQRIAFILLTVSILFFSCVEEKNDIIREGNPKIEKLGENLTQLKELRDNSRYGTVKGQYPEESKQILDDAMAVIGRLIMKMNDGINVSDSEIEEATSRVVTAIENFKSTIRTETQLFPAELYVNGKEGGYIDFGTSPAFSRFGTYGNQSFTVELWVKLSTTSGFGTIVSTYLEDGDEPRYRKGWMINHFNNDYMRISYGLNDYNLWEPGDGFRDLNKWRHVAAVYSDAGVDGSKEGNNPVVIKYYIDGELKKTQINNNPGSVYYNAADDKGKAMTAFIQFNKNGNQDRQAEGYIKDFHIWKTAKSGDEIKRLMNKEIIVTGQEEDLVCGWDFNSTVEDEQSIKDLTGKYSAAVKGKHEWIMLE
ncbi:MAG TPA: hypothetical protein DDW85_03615 [Porphyromonadaceae bacterium]|jgi:hypothetical protein|nr:hypothetical protein [Porphyromonadaceae bacterium]